MLKIGLRQGLYAQFSNKLTHKDKFQKAQKSVAAAMSQSYVHGDAAMYDTFIRAARPWSYRYPLEDVQGSFGNPSSPDSHAAARYVEMRAGEVADVFFEGLKKNAIGEQWYNNYDDTELIPSVFPSIGFWNIVNGCSGIAVAMATSVPQFNLREVNNALIKIIQNQEVDFNEIYCAPDFSCGGTILNAAEVKESLKNGKGASIKLQAKLKYLPDKNMIQATELPYGVFTNTIIDQLAALVEENPNYGIEKVIDYTKQEADIRIYLSKGVNPKKIINKLYKDTSLENWFAINMILLDGGRFPKVFGWREACDSYITHMRECKRNIILFDLDKALKRENIVNGLLIAAASIDEVVSIIRASESPNEAAEKLKTRFSFNDEQVKAILAMKLSSLTKIDGIKLENEKKQLMAEIAEYTRLLENPSLLDEKLIEVLQEIANKFGDERRTKVLNISSTTEDADAPIAVEEKDINIYLLNNNQIIMQDRSEDVGTKRGTKGKKILPNGVEVVNTIYCSNLSTLMAFTNQGRMYSFAVSDLDPTTTNSLYDIISLKDDEHILVLIDGTMMNTYNHLITVSKRGLIKKTRISEYNVKNKKGVAAVKLNSDDELICAALSVEGNKIMISTNNGYYNYYSVDNISSTGRNTAGVKAIRLKDDEWIQSAALIQNKEYHGILTISSSGKGKISSLTEYAETSRGVKGNQIMALGDDETLMAISPIEVNQDKVNLINDNKLITILISEIPVTSRVTMGIKLTQPSNKINIL